MAESKQPFIGAIVTLKPESVQPGGAPIFHAKTNEELQELGKKLERILGSGTHELNENTIIIVTR